MNGTSLPRSALLSLLIHITLFGITLWTARHANHFVMPSPYVVTLVSPGPAATVQQSPPAESVAPQPQAASKPESKMSYEPSKAVRKKKEEQQDVEDRIAALEAKKKIERIGNARKMVSSVVSLKVGGGSASQRQAAQRGNPGSGDYTSKIVGEIQQYWRLPPDLFKDKNMEAIVSIRILKDGSLQVLGIEKSSGSPLFNREALRTIAKASPVTPPPQEMEIGVRFYP